MSAEPPPSPGWQPVESRPQPALRPGPFPPGTGRPRMPAGVQAARVLALVLAVVCLANLWLAASHGGARSAGAAAPLTLLNVLTGVLALRYTSGRDGVRRGSVLLAVLQLVLSFLTLARTPAGVVPLLGNLVLVILLTQTSTRHWFTRPR